jgi:hypothetical protein
VHDVMAAIAHTEDGNGRLLGLEMPDRDPAGCEVEGEVRAVEQCCGLGGAGGAEDASTHPAVVTALEEGEADSAGEVVARQ